MTTNTRASWLGKVQTFFAKPFFSDSRTLLGLWTLIGLIAGLTKLSIHRHNNFEIFRGVYHILYSNSRSMPSILPNTSTTIITAHSSLSS